MTQKKQSTEAAVREIRRRTRRKFAPEEKVRIVLEGLRGDSRTEVNPTSLPAAIPPDYPSERVGIGTARKSGRTN